MHYCSNCGFKLSESANFCPQCGQKLIHEVKPEIQALPEETIPISAEKTHSYKADLTFTLLDPGDVFQERYKIEKVLGRNNDGIVYLVNDEYDCLQRSLKLFYQSYFDNLDKMLGAIVRMSKIKTLSHPNIAKVYEVNQTSKPTYIVSEYIKGSNLSIIKERNPGLLTEEKVREIARQIVNAAIAIRKAGLAIRKLDLYDIVVSEQGNAIILPSGINYDVTDEREDIFNMGLVLAKLFSTSAFYETLYTPLKLIEKKFDYISGITIGINEIIGECLHRNINQRYEGFIKLEKALKDLKPIRQDDVYTLDESDFKVHKNGGDLTLPERRLDIYFWIVIIFIVVFIGILMSTNLLDTVFSHKKTTFKFTGFVTDVKDTTEVYSPIADDSYRRIKSNPQRIELKKDDSGQHPKEININPNVYIPPPQPIFNREEDKQDFSVTSNQTSEQKQQTIPEGLVYIYGGTYSYGTLKKDALDNVSLNGFYISKAEITQAEWNVYMRPIRCSSVGNNLPVDNVSWFDVIIYCNNRSDVEGLTQCYKIIGTGASRSITCNFKANGYRLPTEAEWEYAARANKFTMYSGADSPVQYAWYKSNSDNHIHPVKTKRPNAFGIYDMTGNVSEWCWDWYDSGYPKTMPFINPTGPVTGEYKSIRGGNIKNGQDNSLGVLFRYRGKPTQAYPYVGFRVVRAK